METRQPFATVGGMYDDEDTSGVWSHPITKAIAAKLSGIDAKRAELILGLLATFAAQPANSDYPPLRISTTDDNAVIVEWAFADRRLGFAYEQHHGESGWYLVRKNAAPEHGPLTNLRSNLPRLIKRFLQSA